MRRQLMADEDDRARTPDAFQRLDDAAIAGPDIVDRHQIGMRLDDRRRSLIRAAFFDGSTYEELAARIGSPLGSVKSWIRRGLMQLRECLEQ